MCATQTELACNVADSVMFTMLRVNVVVQESDWCAAGWMIFVEPSTGQSLVYQKHIPILMILAVKQIPGRKGESPLLCHPHFLMFSRFCHTPADPSNLLNLLNTFDKNWNLLEPVDFKISFGGNAQGYLFGLLFH